MPYVVTAKWTVKEGSEAQVRAVIEELVESSRAEPGVLYYQAHEDPDDPRVFFFYEQYVDEIAFQAHVSSDHFARLAQARAIPLLESRERKLYHALGPM
jgi:quinol monooxygenase YgiN